MLSDDETTADNTAEPPNPAPKPQVETPEPTPKPTPKPPEAVPEPKPTPTAPPVTVPPVAGIKVPPIDIEKGEVSKAQVKEIESGKYYTIKQLANELGYSSAWITILCQKGRIKAVKPLGTGWRIPPSEVERIRKEGIPPLPRKEVVLNIEDINIDGKHLDRVKSKPKEKKETPGSKGLGWPLNLLLK